jgi:hypothetical protein
LFQRPEPAVNEVAAIQRGKGLAHGQH